MNRESTLKFLELHVKTDVLMRHLLGVEAAMRGYARKYGENEEEWGIAGLVHDFDWEICPTPEEHPMFGAGLLREAGFPEHIVRAVLTHGDHTGLTRDSASWRRPSLPWTSYRGSSEPWPLCGRARAWTI